MGTQPTHLGKYTLVRRLAVGGMAELFLARATGTHGFEKLVVLKRILPSFAQNSAFTQMFLAEAKLAAALVHPNIAQVFDFGHHDGTYYFTMEYVHGRDLLQIVRAAHARAVPLPLAMMLHIVTGTLAGLHHAHEQHDAAGRALEIVHRDVSPANTLVTYEGNVKVVDFGIAKAAALGPATISGGLKGKVSYMSPEQCRGEPLDRRSDLFAVGILLWELTMGKRLFPKSKDGNHLVTMKAIEDAQVPRPRDILPDYPERLEQIVLRALAHDRNDRYQTALDFRVALEDFAREERMPMSSASMAQLMNQLFPVAQREPMPSSTGNFDGVTHQPAPTGLGPDDPTRPEPSLGDPTFTADTTEAMLRAHRSRAPVYAALGAAAVLLGGGAYYLSTQGSSPAPSAAPEAGAGLHSPVALEPAQAPVPTPAEPEPEPTAEPEPAPSPEVEPEPTPSKRRRRTKGKTPKAAEPEPKSEPKKSAEDIFMVPNHSRGKDGSL